MSIIVLLLVPLSAGAQSIFPVQIEAASPTPGFTIPVEFTEMVEPALFAVNNPRVAGGVGVAIPLASLVERCADDDGCSVRLININLTSDRRSQTPPAILTIDGAGQFWDLATVAGGNASGENGDGSAELVLDTYGYGSQAPKCEIYDDLSAQPGSDFNLAAYYALGGIGDDAMRCVLRIDD